MTWRLLFKVQRLWDFRFNCTIPHKVNVGWIRRISFPMGAVNCVVRKEGQWIGENTDGKGFVSSLRELTDPKNKKVVIFGAGGAARAISVEVALAWSPAHKHRESLS